MQKRKLGKSNLEVSAIGFGRMDLGAADIELTPDDLRHIDAPSKVQMKGER